jgi:hypothetical protein
VKALTKMKFPSLKGRGKEQLVLKLLVVVDVPILLQPLVSPRVKVIVPAPSKHINPMTIMTTMRTSPWKPSPRLFFAHQDLLVLQLKWGL